MFRMIITWVVIIPNLIVSYHALRNPFMSLEMLSLGLNFIATTALFYIYATITTVEDENKEAGATPINKPDENALGLYKLAFGSLIEDMLVWMGLFFLLYNIVPATLYVHNMVGKNI